MEEVLEKLPVSEDIKVALLEPKSQSLLRIIYDAVTLYERGDWHLTTIQCYKLKLEYDTLGDYMLQAIAWAQSYERAIPEAEKKKKSA